MFLVSSFRYYLLPRSTSCGWSLLEALGESKFQREVDTIDSCNGRFDAMWDVAVVLREQIVRSALPERKERKGKER
jgi:hypothetical protein